jgi:hypothetical protein
MKIVRIAQNAGPGVVDVEERLQVLELVGLTQLLDAAIR